MSDRLSATAPAALLCLTVLCSSACRKQAAPGNPRVSGQVLRTARLERGNAIWIFEQRRKLLCEVRNIAPLKRDAASADRM